MVHLPYYELYLSNISCNNNIVVICSIFFPSALYHSNIYHRKCVRKYSIHRPRIRSGIFRVRISMALFRLQDPGQINKALFLQTSSLIEIERDVIIMSSIGTRRTPNIKTNPASSEAIEVERIIRRDGFNYFLIANE
jgi:hypothetical protein